MKLLLVLMQPRAALMESICERTCELAGELHYVDSARVVSRQIMADGSLVCVQRWRARADVPELLRPHLDVGLLDWTLTLEREPGAHECRWRAESAAIQLSGRCLGTIEFAPAIGGRGTRMRVRGEFTAANEGLRTIFARLAAQHWRGLAEAAVRAAAATAQEA
jgi:hypothetical protein